MGLFLPGMMAENAQITLAGAFALSVGIAIQNFPEGAIISLPMRSEEGVKRSKAFLYGVLSGVVEPHRRRTDYIAGVLYYAAAALFACICRRRDALCGRGGIDPGIIAG